MRLFREARNAPIRVLLGKTLLYSAIIWCLALWGLPTLIASVEARMQIPNLGVPAHRALGVALFIVASVANLTVAAVMVVRGRGTPLPVDTASELVIAGPYAYVRNPMAMAGLAQGLGVALIMDSLMVVNYVVLAGVLWDLVVRPMEESDLLQRFGQPYLDYRDSVRCWIPSRTPYLGPHPALASDRGEA